MTPLVPLYRPGTLTPLTQAEREVELRKRSDALAKQELEAAARLSKLRGELDETTTELDAIAAANAIHAASAKARGLSTEPERAPAPFPVRPDAAVELILIDVKIYSVAASAFFIEHLTITFFVARLKPHEERAI